MSFGLHATDNLQIRFITTSWDENLIQHISAHTRSYRRDVHTKVMFRYEYITFQGKIKYTFQSTSQYLRVK